MTNSYIRPYEYREKYGRKRKATIFNRIITNKVRLKIRNAYIQPYKYRKKYGQI